MSVKKIYVPATDECVVSVAEFAKMYGYSQNFVRAGIRDEIIPGVKIGRTYRAFVAMKSEIVPDDESDQG